MSYMLGHRDGGAYCSHLGGHDEKQDVQFDGNLVFPALIKDCVHAASSYSE